MMKNSEEFGPRIYRSSIPQPINFKNQSKSKREFDSLWNIKPFNKQDSLRLKLANDLPGLKLNKENQKVINKLDSPRIYKTPMIPTKK